MAYVLDQEEAVIQRCWTCGLRPAVIRSTLHEPLMWTSQVNHCQLCRDTWFETVASPILADQRRVVMHEYPV
jgi:hypothetical protein